MIRTELRIVLAAVATFVTLAGIAVAIHGLLFDSNAAVAYGVAAITAGISACVVLLNLRSHDPR